MALSDVNKNDPTLAIFWKLHVKIKKKLLQRSFEVEDAVLKNEFYCVLNLFVLNCASVLRHSFWQPSSVLHQGRVKLVFLYILGVNWENETRHQRNDWWVCSKNEVLMEIINIKYPNWENVLWRFAFFTTKQCSGYG